MDAVGSKHIEKAFTFCPNCGATRPDQSTPFQCTKCAYANFFGPVLAVGALIENAAGKLLLVRRAREPGKGKWGLPGGFVDQGESAEQATAREVLEETGLVVSGFDYMYSAPNWYNYHGFISPVIDLFFRCEVVSTDTLQLADDELEYSEWSQPTDKHLNNMAFQSNRNALEHWLHRYAK